MAPDIGIQRAIGKLEDSLGGATRILAVAIHLSGSVAATRRKSSGFMEMHVERKSRHTIAMKLSRNAKRIIQYG
jgi:hypothetical protein